MATGLRSLKAQKIFLNLGLKTAVSSFDFLPFGTSTGDTETLIVCTHGLIKKTNKTPKKDIEKAEMIKEKYFKGLI